MGKSYMKLIVDECKTGAIADYIIQGLKKDYGDLQLSWSYNYLMIHTILLKHGDKNVARFVFSSYECKRQKLTEEEMKNKADFDVNTARVKNLYFKAMESLFEGYKEDRAKVAAYTKKASINNSSAEKSINPLD